MKLLPLYPTIKKTLYFSSNGHGGFGEADIFVSYRIDDSWTNWTAPLNLGSTINSADYDAYFVMGNNLEVYFTSDRSDEHSNIYYTRATGKFTFANQEAQFIYKNLPSDGVKLYVYNEDGVLIDSVITDGFGNFSYKKLSADSEYTFRLADAEDADMVGSVVYLLNEEGEKVKRMVFTEDKQFVDSKKVTQLEELKGEFNYNELPMKNTALVVFDENGFPLDTIYTDEQGRFNYQKIAYDGSISIVPLNMNDDWNAIEMFLTDENGKRTKLMNRNNQLVFESVDETKIVAIPKEVEAIDDGSKETTKSFETIEGWRGMPATERNVYFAFKENTLTGDDKKKLGALALLLKSEKMLTIQLIGHTDNVGTEEDNIKRGLERAKAAKQYLVDQKIDSERIKISSKGETNPIDSNSTASGRAKNRRVEVVLN